MPICLVYAYLFEKYLIQNMKMLISKLFAQYGNYQHKLSQSLNKNVRVLLQAE